MTVASTTAKAGPYDGDDATVEFDFTFKAQAVTDIKVVSTITTSGVQVDTELEQDTEYSVTLNADQNSSPGGVVTIVTAPATGEQITVLRSVATTQGASLPNQGGFYPKVIENALDKLTMLLQQLSEESERSLKLSVADSITNLQDLLITINNSVSAAAGSESAAGSYATNAHNSEVAAAASETAAGLSEVAAAASETAAGLSEVAAAASETAAGLSEVAAAASAVTAGGHATTATTQAGIATAKAVLTAADAIATAADRVQTGLDAGTATTKAATATTKADEAAASESAAANSASLAAGSAAAAVISSNSAADSAAAAEAAAADAVAQASSMATAQLTAVLDFDLNFF